MRNLIWVACGALLVTSGCVRAGGDGDHDNEPDLGTAASAVSIYNCSTDGLSVFVRQTQNGAAWTWVSSTGTFKDDACPSTGDTPVIANLGTGPHTVRLVHWNKFDCDGNEPEGNCTKSDQFYMGDDGAGVVDWVVRSP